MKPSSSTSSSTTTITDFVDSLATLINSSAQLSIDLLRSFGESTPSLGSLPSLPSLPSSREKPSHGCSCAIPPACWLPRDAGDVRTYACPGATASLRIRVENCGIKPRTIAIDVGGSPPGVTVTPATLHLDGLESGTALITFAIPPSAHDHADFPFRIWIRGCKTHYVHWTVVAGEGDCRCRTIEIDDCPDTVHHWYDHFYCDHPCQH